MDGQMDAPFVQRTNPTPWTAVDPTIVRDERLSALAKLLYVVLATYASMADRSVYPSRARLASEASMSVSSVARSLRELEEAGVITTRHRLRADGGQTSSLYLLHDFAPPRAVPTPPRPPCRTERPPHPR